MRGEGEAREVGLDPCGGLWQSVGLWLLVVWSLIAPEFVVSVTLLYSKPLVRWDREPFDQTLMQVFALCRSAKCAPHQQSD